MHALDVDPKWLLIMQVDLPVTFGLTYVGTLNFSFSLALIQYHPPALFLLKVKYAFFLSEFYCHYTRQGRKVL